MRKTTPLEEILSLYKEALRIEDEVEYEEIHIEAPSYEELTGEVKPKQIKDVEVPEEGDVIEVFPSLDGLEMIFLVFRKYENGYVELLPMNKFWELGTPEDVLVNFEGERYIVQTDLGIDVPEENFSKRFGNRKVFLLGKLTPQQMKEIEDVYEGRKKGIGNMRGGPKGEFKTLESRRYFLLFARTIEEEEFFLPAGKYQYKVEHEWGGEWKGEIETKGESLFSLCSKVFEKEGLYPLPSGVQWIEREGGLLRICLYEEGFYSLWLVTLWR